MKRIMRLVDKSEKLLDIILGLLIVVIVFVLAEMVFSLAVNTLPLDVTPNANSMVKEISMMFILLEIIVLLKQYILQGHHIPIRYLIIIGITAIGRDILLAHSGSGLNVLFYTLAILVLVGVLYIFDNADTLRYEEEVILSDGSDQRISDEDDELEELL